MLKKRKYKIHEQKTKVYQLNHLHFNYFTSSPIMTYLTFFQ